MLASGCAFDLSQCIHSSVLLCATITEYLRVGNLQQTEIHRLMFLISSKFNVKMAASGEGLPSLS